MDIFNTLSGILFRVSAWYFKSKADGKIDASEWAQLLNVILNTLEDEGVKVDVTVRDNETGVI